MTTPRVIRVVVSDHDCAAAVTAARQVWAMTAIGLLEGDATSRADLSQALLHISPTGPFPMAPGQALAIGAAVSEALEYGAAHGDPTWLDRAGCERFLGWFRRWSGA